MSYIESLFKYLALDDIDCNIPIYIDEYEEPNGYGMLIDDIVLSAYHVVRNSNKIIINNQNYKIDLYIDEYDIVILNKIDNIINYDYFLNKLNTYVTYKIKHFDNIVGKTFNVLDRKLILENIECNHLVTNIFPSIPVYIFSSVIKNFDYAGYSGSMIKSKNNILCMMISENIDTNKITGLPLEIIYKILSGYISNNMKFYYLPIILTDNIVQNNFRTLVKNDQIKTINNQEIENNMIYDSDLDNKILLDTYILLNGIQNICIEYYRNYKNKKKEYKNNISLKVFNYKNISINFRETNKDICISDIIFSELSEETIIDMYNKNIKIPNNIYDNIFASKKIFFKNIINSDYKFNRYLLSNNIDINNEIYILDKISGKKIRNIKDIEKFTKYKNITIELINTNMDSIKIKI